jgi:hypothetical protein
MPLFTVFRKASKPVQNLKNYSARVSVINRLIPELEKLVQVYDAQAMMVA